MTSQPASVAPLPATSPTQPNGQAPEAKEPATSNGQRPVPPNRLPHARRLSKAAKLVLTVGALVLLVGAGSGAYLMVGRGLRANRTDLVTHQVRREKLLLTIVERGALESAENNDIVCRVKAG